MYSLLVLTVAHLDYTWRNHGFSVFTQNRANSTLHVYRGAAAPRSCPYIDGKQHIAMQSRAKTRRMRKNK